MRTSPLVDFAIYDSAIKQDSTPAASSIQSFSKVADLEIPNSSTTYGSYEPDFWLLDGSYKLMPTVTTDVHVGWMSAAMSGAAGAFSVPPVLTITFGSVQSVNGLTLKFSQQTGDWADDIDVAYYNAADALIRTDNYTPTTYEFYTAQAVASFKKIIVTFNSTNKAYRYLRLQSIDYGQVIHFTDADIKSCTVVEEIDPLSLSLPISTLELTVFSTSSDFSIVNPAGVYASLENNQALDVYEIVGNSQLYIGRFYLNEWESLSENIANFRCVDALGVKEIAETNYYTTQAGVWVNKALADVILEILGDTVFEYEIDASFAGTVLYGWIPLTTKRETLKQIAFTIGAYITCARSHKIQIKPFELASDLVVFDYTLTSAEKGINSPVSLRPFITGVKILTSYYNYLYLTGDRIVFNGHLSLGDHILVFPDGVIDEEASISVGGTGVQSFFDFRANHIEITVTTAGTFEIIATVYYERITSPAVLNNGSLPAGTPTNIINIDDATLVTNGITTTSYTIVDNVIQRVYDYYQQRIIQKTKLYAPAAKVGDSILISSQGRQIGAIVEKMTLDLSGGFTAQVEAVGVVVPL